MPQINENSVVSAPNEKIDAVYLWCDGSDPAFREEKVRLQKALGLPSEEDHTGDQRFADNEELRFSLRGLEKNAPWVNHIWIVTNRQRPAWLRDHPKVTIVDHKEIIPAHLLPTFNSGVIEAYIDRIPGLQEKFIYLNDDMFIARPVDPGFFFEGDLPVVRLRPPQKDMPWQTIEEVENVIRTEAVHSFRRTQLRAWLVFSKKHGARPIRVLAHAVDGLTKSAMREVYARYPEILETNVSPFRTGKCIHRLIFQLEMAYAMGAKLVTAEKPGFLLKHFPALSRQKLETFEGTECEKIRERTLRYRPVMFCFNADPKMDPENRQKTKQFLEKLFPEPSPFEK